MRRQVLVALSAFILSASAAIATAAVDLTTVQVNLNQVGYRPGDAKIALVETNRKLTDVGAVARILTYPALAAGPLADAPLTVDRKRYGKYRRNYEVNFSALVTPGTYVIQIRDSADILLSQSPPTTIAPAPFDALIPLALRFFGAQRCGSTSPLVHAACHSADGVAVGGPSDGSAVDVSGGWHDAGDYIKFASTISYVTFLQLFALRELAPPTLDPGLRTLVRDEARIGVEWLLKAHPTSTSFYFQVADTRDHDVDWRLPENDTVYPGGRPAYYGLGANLAGRTAAALALCAAEWQADDAPLAAACQTAAAEIYSLGRSIADGSSSDAKHALVVSCVETPEQYSANQLNCDFYAEDSWADDMALGAIELFELTGTMSYRTDALAYGAITGPAYEPLRPGAVNDIAFYEIYPHAPASGSGLTQPIVLSLLGEDADRIRDWAARDRYNVAEKKLLWGSSAQLAGDGVTCLLRAKLTGETACPLVARQQLDYLLGRNPFGASFLVGAGTVFPQNPHHGVAVLLPSAWYTPGMEIGSIAGGPARRSQYPFRGDPDFKAAILGDTASPFARFQHGKFHYHDLTADYVSNEPALDYNANLLALLLAHTS